jgi:hypothetical protein
MLERDHTIVDARPQGAMPGRSDLPLTARGNVRHADSKYKPHFPDRLIEMMTAGCSYAQVAKEFETHPRTMHYWCDNFPEFEEAYRRGAAAREAYFDKLALEHLVTDKEGPKFDTRLYMYIKRADFQRYDTQQANINFNVNQQPEGEKEVKELVTKYIDTKHKETI